LETIAGTPREGHSRRGFYTHVQGGTLSLVGSLALYISSVRRKPWDTLSCTLAHRVDKVFLRRVIQAVTADTPYPPVPFRNGVVLLATAGKGMPLTLVPYQRIASAIWQPSDIFITPVLIDMTGEALFRVATDYTLRGELCLGSYLVCPLAPDRRLVVELHPSA